MTTIVTLEIPNIYVKCPEVAQYILAAYQPSIDTIEYLSQYPEYTAQLLKNKQPLSPHTSTLLKIKSQLNCTPAQWECANFILRDCNVFGHFGGKKGKWMGDYNRFIDNIFGSVLFRSYWDEAVFDASYRGINQLSENDYCDYSVSCLVDYGGGVIDWYGDELIPVNIRVMDEMQMSDCYDVAIRLRDLYLREYTDKYRPPQCMCKSLDRFTTAAMTTLSDSQLDSWCVATHHSCVCEVPQKGSWYQHEKHVRTSSKNTLLTEIRCDDRCGAIGQKHKLKTCRYEALINYCKHSGHASMVKSAAKR